jgi:hypothetical protein
VVGYGGQIVKRTITVVIEAFVTTSCSTEPNNHQQLEKQELVVYHHGVNALIMLLGSWNKCSIAVSVSKS